MCAISVSVSPSLSDTLSACNPEVLQERPLRRASDDKDSLIRMIRMTRHVPDFHVRERLQLFRQVRYVWAFTSVQLAVNFHELLVP